MRIDQLNLNRLQYPPAARTCQYSPGRDRPPRLAAYRPNDRRPISAGDSLRSTTYHRRSAGLLTPRPPRFNTWVYHRGTDVTVSEEFLNRPNVIPIFEKM